MDYARSEACTELMFQDNEDAVESWCNRRTDGTGKLSFYICSSSIFPGRKFPDWYGIPELHLNCVGIRDCARILPNCAIQF